MATLSPRSEFFMDLAKAKTVTTRRLDGRLSQRGIGFSDFMILYHLSQAPEGKLRRIDLAERIGFTASGVTRMLIPMEKIGLVKREVNESDARVSFVALAPGGKRLFAESLEDVDMVAEDLIPQSKMRVLRDFSDLLAELGKAVV